MYEFEFAPIIGLSLKYHWKVSYDDKVLIFKTTFGIQAELDTVILSVTISGFVSKPE